MREEGGRQHGIRRRKRKGGRTAASFVPQDFHPRPRDGCFFTTAGYPALSSLQEGTEGRKGEDRPPKAERDRETSEQELG